MPSRQGIRPLGHHALYLLCYRRRSVRQLTHTSESMSNSVEFWPVVAAACLLAGPPLNVSALGDCSHVALRLSVRGPPSVTVVVLPLPSILPARHRLRCGTTPEVNSQ